MTKLRLMTNPELFISEAALGYLRRFLDTVKNIDPSKDYVLTLRWAENTRVLESQFADGLDHIKKTQTRDEYERELAARANEKAMTIAPHIELGAIERHVIPLEKISNISDIEIYVREEDFRSDGVEQREVDLYTSGDKEKLVLNISSSAGL